jgi:serine/threonine-protein kinase
MVERVARHLAVCPVCESALEAVRGVEDAFVRNLRLHLRDAPPGSVSGGAPTGVAPAAEPYPPVSVSARLGPLPRRFGKYEILEKLAVGGMSVVFKARQLHPNRLVALKIPHGAALAGTEPFARFQLEIEAVVRLQHDHIVRIYECGEEDGWRYFSMEYVEGGTLAARVSGAPMSGREAAELVQTLARTVHFAHQQGILHRDLKPANVLLGRDGSVKLTDFGLAKCLDVDEGLTGTDAILGTAKYMAPEQARGDAGKIGIPTDVYGLGTILYECLTGRPPFQGASHQEILRQVEAAALVPPSRIRPGLSRNLEAVCLKCLDRSPEGRYASAEQLAEDLGRWLRGDATLARPERWPARLWRTARRHPALTAALMLAVLVGVLTPAAAYLRDPARQRERVERPLRQAQPVTLIGATGAPAWFQVSTDPSFTKIGTAPDGTFSVTAFRLGLVELLSDPQTESYRFSAEVRQDRGAEPGGRVGMYFMHSKRSTAGDQVMHEFCGIEFNELHKPLAPPQPLTGQSPTATNPVQVILRRYLEPGIVPVDHTVYGPRAGFFVRQPYSWRRVAVEVTPARIRASWEGELFCEFSRTELVKRTQHLLDGPAGRAGLQPDLSARGAIGLYISGATASFRSVAVEPLGGEK